MYIKKVKFTNLKGFDSLEFDFTRKDKSFAGWTVFVGGNSSGKSTLLKGIALALMGAEVGRIYTQDLSSWIKYGQLQAEATLTIFREDIDTIQMKGRSPDQIEAGIYWDKAKEEDIPSFKKRKTNGRTENGIWNPNMRGWFCAGYGPMRRLSGSSSESMRFTLDQGIISRFATLFREDASLSESETWLRQYYTRTLETEGEDKNEAENLFQNVKAFLNDSLLPLGMQIGKITTSGNINVFVTNKNGIELPMRDVSDGCRGIYATILDLIHHLYSVYGANGLFKTDDTGRIVVDCPGVVLIDEIEAHLHPQWQIDIVEWIRLHFPKIQFLVTTHSSLIAQCADDNGIFVLPLQNESGRDPRQLDEEETNKIRMGKAGKTLLGAAFGLKSTRSSWAVKQIELWKKLNSKSKVTSLTDSEGRKHSELKTLLDQTFDSDEREVIE